jgi:phosphatidate cytidylyltransferase
VSEPGQAANKWSDLGTRSISALILAPVALFALHSGSSWSQLLFAFVAVLMALEYVSIVHADDKQQFALHSGAGLAAVILSGAGLPVTAIGIIILCSLVSISIRRKAHGRDNNWWSATGVAYVALPALALTLLRDDKDWGWNAILWLALVVWATDIGAYFAGRTVGGPKLAPRFSPKKTWAGLLGGMIAAALVSYGLCSYLGLPTLGPVLIAPILAALAQVGDIYESALKRQFNLKDTSNLIPGHGGVMDRVDGFIAAALVAAVIGLLHDPQSVAKGLLFW